MSMAGNLASTDPGSHSGPRSFEELYRVQHEPMLRLAYLLTQSRQAAEELVHDSFVRVQPRWRDVEQPAAYLRRTVANACYSWHRRRRREEVLAARPQYAYGFTGWGPAATAQPEYDEMWDALAGLAPRRRAALVLRYYCDFSEAEIADTLGCRPGTVKSLTSRGLADLRKAIEQ